MYKTTFFLSSSACCSAHSVEPSSIGSSASQLVYNDRALRLPTLLGESAESLGLGQQRDLTRQRVGRAKDPAVVMIAADDPLVRPGRALHHRDDVIDRLLLPIGFDRQMD